MPKKRIQGAATAAPELQYVGPAYRTGIRVIVLGPQMFRPHTMTPEEINDLIQKYPPAANWWAPAHDSNHPSEVTDTESVDSD